MSKKPIARIWAALQRPAQAAVMLIGFVSCAGTALATQGDEGKALLETNCGRCHAVVAGGKSPLAKAPNLWDVLSAYPVERLDFELAEGIGSRHQEMPQIQFSDEDITRIFYYLHGGEASPP